MYYIVKVLKDLYYITSTKEKKKNKEDNKKRNK